MLKNNVGYEHFLYGSFQFYNLLTFFQYTLACLPKKLQFELQTVFPIRNLETEKPIVIFAIVFLNLFFSWHSKHILKDANNISLSL